MDKILLIVISTASSLLTAKVKKDIHSLNEDILREKKQRISQLTDVQNKLSFIVKNTDSSDIDSLFEIKETQNQINDQLFKQLETERNERREEIVRVARGSRNNDEITRESLRVASDELRNSIEIETQNRIKLVQETKNIIEEQIKAESDLSQVARNVIDARLTKHIADNREERLSAINEANLLNLNKRMEQKDILTQRIQQSEQFCTQKITESDENNANSRNILNSKFTISIQNIDQEIVRINSVNSDQQSAINSNSSSIENIQKINEETIEQIKKNTDRATDAAAIAEQATQLGSRSLALGEENNASIGDITTAISNIENINQQTLEKIEKNTARATDAAAIAEQATQLGSRSLALGEENNASIGDITTAISNIENINQQTLEKIEKNTARATDAAAIAEQATQLGSRSLALAEENNASIGDITTAISNIENINQQTLEEIEKNTARATDAAAIAEQATQLGSRSLALAEENNASISDNSNSIDNILIRVEQSELSCTDKINDLNALTERRTAILSDTINQIGQESQDNSEQTNAIVSEFRDDTLRRFNLFQQEFRAADSTYNLQSIRGDCQLRNSLQILSEQLSLLEQRLHNIEGKPQLILPSFRMFKQSMDNNFSTNTSNVYFIDRVFGIYQVTDTPDENNNYRFRISFNYKACQPGSDGQFESSTDNRFANVQFLENGDISFNFDLANEGTNLPADFDQLKNHASSSNDGIQRYSYETNLGVEQLPTLQLIRSLIFADYELKLTNDGITPRTISNINSLVIRQFDALTDTWRFAINLDYLDSNSETQTENRYFTLSSTILTNTFTGVSSMIQVVNFDIGPDFESVKNAAQNDTAGANAYQWEYWRTEKLSNIVTNTLGFQLNPRGFYPGEISFEITDDESNSLFNKSYQGGHDESIIDNAEFEMNKSLNLILRDSFNDSWNGGKLILSNPYGSDLVVSLGDSAPNYQSILKFEYNNSGINVINYDSNYITIHNSQPEPLPEPEPVIEPEPEPPIDNIISYQITSPQGAALSGLNIEQIYPLNELVDGLRINAGIDFENDDLWMSYIDSIPGAFIRV